MIADQILFQAAYDQRSRRLMQIVEQPIVLLGKPLLHMRQILGYVKLLQKRLAFNRKQLLA